VTLHLTTVHLYTTRRFKEFKRGRQSLEDDFQSGWLSKAVNSISIAIAGRLIMAYQNVEVLEIAKSYKFQLEALKT